MGTTPSWHEIQELETSEAYPEAIDALEERLASNPEETEAVIRLGFNLWYAVAEGTRLGRNKRFGDYPERFTVLLERYGEKFRDVADFCWAYGLGIQLFWFHFPRMTEEQGNELLNRARALDPFWASLFRPGADLSRLKGRGIFARYYNVH